jgi:hypothetical protein
MITKGRAIFHIKINTKVIEKDERAEGIEIQLSI